MYPYHLRSIGFRIRGNVRETHLLAAVICGGVDFCLLSPAPGFDRGPPLFPGTYECAEHLPVSPLSPVGDVFIFNRHK